MRCVSERASRLVAMILLAIVLLIPKISSADSFDWRYVNGSNWNTPAKSQFGGTCWAFNPTSSMEARFMLTRNDCTYFIPDFSEQQLCWETDPDMGSTAGGGGFDPLFNYYRDHGVVSEADCPVYPDSTYWDAPPPGTPVHPADYATRCFKSTTGSTKITNNTTAYLKTLLKTNGPLLAGMNGSDVYENLTALAEWLSGFRWRQPFGFHCRLRRRRHVCQRWILDRQE